MLLVSYWAASLWAAFIFCFQLHYQCFSHFTSFPSNKLHWKSHVRLKSMLLSFKNNHSRCSKVNLPMQGRGFSITERLKMGFPFLLFTCRSFLFHDAGLSNSSNVILNSFKMVRFHSCQQIPTHIGYELYISTLPLCIICLSGYEVQSQERLCVCNMYFNVVSDTCRKHCVCQSHYWK